MSDDERDIELDDVYTQPANLTDKDEADIHRLYAEPDGVEPPNFHPILQIWRAALDPIEGEAAVNITPQWATRIVSSYVGMTFADMLEFQERYFAKLMELRDILDGVIASDEECLTYSTPEEDIEGNRTHYLNLLLSWQTAFLQWELDWDCADPCAAVELAAVSEAHKVFFGAQQAPGLTAYLDNIGMEFTDADQQMMADTLNEFAGRDRE